MRAKQNRMDRMYGAIVLLVLDLAWVRLVMHRRYSGLVRHVQMGRGMRARLVPGLLAYTLMVVGLVVFVLDDATRPFGHAVARGAIFGAVLYGVYNGTAAAVFDRWETSTAVLDVAWGAAVYAGAAAASRAFRS